MSVFTIGFKGKAFYVRIEMLSGSKSRGWMSYAGLMLALRAHDPEIGNIHFEDATPSV